MAPSVMGSLNEKDEKAKKAKQPIVIWPEWTEQDIAQEKWVRNQSPRNPVNQQKLLSNHAQGKLAPW